MWTEEDWDYFKNTYTYEKLTDIRHARGINYPKASPPIIAKYLLEYYLQAEEKPITIDEWIQDSWIEGWYYPHLYYEAIKTLIKDNIITLYPDRTFSIDLDKAITIVEREKEERRMREEAKRIRRERIERERQQFLEEVIPEFADCLDYNEQLVDEYGKLGRWLYLDSRNYDSRLLPHSIVFVRRYRRYTYSTQGVGLIGEVISNNGDTATIRFLCNDLVEEIPIFWCSYVLVDSRRKNILLE